MKISIIQQRNNIHFSFSSLLSTQIDNLLRSSKIPIIVGGTNYYIESILWRNLVSEIGTRAKFTDDGVKLSRLKREFDIFENISSMDEIESPKLHEYLKLIDPPMANRIHPNNKRKIIR